MKNTADIVNQIVDTVYPNEFEQIDAQKLQDLHKEQANSFVNKLDVLRSGSANVVIGEQTIFFSNPLPSSNYTLSIVDSQGLGVYWISQDENGFTVNASSDGTIKYIAIINI